MSEQNRGRTRFRITVDTNLFVSGLIRSGTPPNRLLRAWVRQAFQLVTSAALRAEVADVIQRPKFDRYTLDAQLIAAVLEALVTAEQVLPPTNLPIHCRDPKDDIVLSC